MADDEKKVEQLDELILDLQAPGHASGDSRKSHKVSAVVRMHVQGLLDGVDPETDRRRGMTRSIFLEHVVDPLRRAEHQLAMTRPRRRRPRRKALSLEARALRLMFLMRGESESTLATTFDQSATTTWRDCDFLVQLSQRDVVQKHVRVPRRTSPEYEAIVGQGAFRGIRPRVAYSGDMTFVEIAKPTCPFRKKDYYCGNKKKNGVYFLTLTDCYGITRLVTGHMAAKVKDKEAILRTGLTGKLKR